MDILRVGHPGDMLYYRNWEDHQLHQQYEQYRIADRASATCFSSIKATKKYRYNIQTQTCNQHVLIRYFNT
jgi:hypothetical protein